ncbi:helix-turn-helix domain-containing protein [Neptuniibacter sp. QD37_11]|uniref:helix-turn-helix domain-containing protein n=1 Tax=Neptuniibacter sp. QD37_11 TaxID=3398209 RepID=UPI0039F55A1F
MKNEIDKVLTSKEAADFLKLSEYTLRRSRMEGTLCGVESPPFIKLGRQVKYLSEDLLIWLQQFPKQNSTCHTD